MIAYMKDDEYYDLVPDFPYEIDKMMPTQYLKLKGNPRRYRASSFCIYHKGERISIAKACRIQRANKVLEKVGIKK